ncbi:MAG: toxin HicA [Actinomycetota bacterium]
MQRILKVLEEISSNPGDVRFKDLYRVCVFFFGEPRVKRGSHIIFRMPWSGDPRINIQNSKGKAKEYQVRQVLLAIEKLRQEGRSRG